MTEIDEASGCVVAETLIGSGDQGDGHCVSLQASYCGARIGWSGIKRYTSCLRRSDLRSPV
jgi:hypothetical protein